MNIPNAEVRGCTPYTTSAGSLVELMVSAGVASLALMMVMGVYVSTNRSFVATGNYVSLNQCSRLALEQMTRDIRRSKDLLSFSTNQVVFQYSVATNLVYRYDPTSGTLTSWKTGDSKTNCLLSGCNYLQFSMYGNIPQAGGSFTNVTSVSQAKCISVNWRCSRSILRQKVNTEDMQEALIVIRSKPVI
jgi:hypothetical protein